MKRWVSGGIVAMACVFGATLATTSASTSGLIGVQELPQAPGQEITLQLCSGSCHGIERFTGEHRSKSQWADTIEQMKGSGLKGADDDLATAIRYLTMHFGVQVRINKATAKQIDDALILDAGQADAIVKYRDEKGPFADFAALLLVPGLDAKKLEEQKANIVFGTE